MIGPFWHKRGFSTRKVQKTEVIFKKFESAEKHQWREEWSLGLFRNASDLGF